MAASQSGIFSLQEFTDLGSPLVGGRLYTYSYGTTALKTAYTDVNGLIPQTYTNDGLGGSYIALNARGELPAPLYLASGSYDIALKRADGSTVWTRRADPIADIGAAVQANLDAYAASVAALGGSALVGFIQDNTGAVKRTVQDELRDWVSVKSYGAVGDGITDDTPAFVKACVASQLVYVPDSSSSYLVKNLKSNGTRIYGPGKIKTSGGTVIELNTVSLDVDGGPLRVMFIESDHQGWEELLDIKSCGYSAIMAFQWDTALADVINDAESVGLKVLVHSQFTPSNKATWATLGAAAVAFDAHPSVVGYYVFDEPASTAISVADQDAGLTIFRGLTSKPLCCSESSVTYSPTGAISANYDQIFIDVYYPDSSSTANDQIATFVRDITAFSSASPRAKLIPLVGLFNDAGFNKTTSLTAQLATVMAKFSHDGTFGVFCWNAGTAGTYQGVRNVADYRAAAMRLSQSAPTLKPWRVEVVPIGTLFTSSSRLGSIFVNCTDGSSPGIPGAAGLIPWYTQNTGVATSNRQNVFTDNGLMYTGTASRGGFSGMPSGICCAYLRWDDRTAAAAATVTLGTSSTLGYTSAGTVTQVLASGTAVAFYGQLDAGGSFGNMPTMDVTTVVSKTAPYCYLKGYLTFTDVPAVAF